MLKNYRICLMLLSYITLSYADCKLQISDFSFQNQQPFSSYAKGKWGYKANQFSLNSEQQQCATNPDWSRQRLLAAADYWIKQKLNYCHHHTPDFRTTDRQILKQQTTGDEFCANNLNLANNQFNGQQIRWNYSGVGNETIENWQNNRMWYGFDCSDFTAWLYNFGLGIFFTPSIYLQAGLIAVDDGRSPNMQRSAGNFQNGMAPGKLLCRDGSLEQNELCTSGYFSTIDKNGLKTIQLTDKDYAHLNAGDLMYVGATQHDFNGLANGQNIVTHTYMWTGKKIGNGINQVPISIIAPHKPYEQDSCKPQAGQWVIIDSTYQGPDYRAFCSYYSKNIWGVRRVIR
jgi:hypothetical protein